MSAPVYVALLHYPIMNRHGATIATAVTNLDIHDIARTCRTYGVKKYFIVTPIEEQHKVVGRILSHWKSETSKEWHPDRYNALARVELVHDFEAVKREITEKHHESPEVVFTDARSYPNSITYADYRVELSEPSRSKPALVCFGTGYGISESFFPEVHRILTPVNGPKGDPDGDYNHLSVRAAAAIILDRLLGT